MTGGELSAEEAERLTGSLAWHFDCHAEYPTGSYKSLGIQNALMIVELIVAARVAAVEGERDEAQAMAERARMDRAAYGQRALAAEAEAKRYHDWWTAETNRSHVAEAEVARLTAEVKHWKDHAQEAGDGFTQVCRDAARISARNVELTALVESLTALACSPEADRYRDEACRGVVGLPYANNRYVRLLDDLRAVLREGVK